MAIGDNRCSVMIHTQSVVKKPTLGLHLTDATQSPQTPSWHSQSPDRCLRADTVPQVIEKIRFQCLRGLTCLITSPYGVGSSATAFWSNR
jgi:hypothetical protein